MTNDASNHRYRLPPFSKQKTVDNLRAVGYKRESTVHDIDTFYLTGEEIDGHKHYLFARHDKKNKTYSVIHQKLVSGTTAPLETKINLSAENFGKIKYIFSALHGEKCTVEKNRITFSKKNGSDEIVIDNVTDLGWFLELPAKGSTGFARNLGLNECDRVPLAHYADMMQTRIQEMIANGTFITKKDVMKHDHLVQDELENKYPIDFERHNIFKELDEKKYKLTKFQKQHDDYYCVGEVRTDHDERNGNKQYLSLRHDAVTPYQEAPIVDRYMLIHKQVRALGTLPTVVDNLSLEDYKDLKTVFSQIHGLKCPVDKERFTYKKQEYLDNKEEDSFSLMMDNVISLHLMFCEIETTNNAPDHILTQAAAELGLSAEHLLRKEDNTQIRYSEMMLEKLKTARSTPRFLP